MNWNLTHADYLKVLANNVLIECDLAPLVGVKMNKTYLPSKHTANNRQ